MALTVNLSVFIILFQLYSLNSFVSLLKLIMIKAKGTVSSFSPGTSSAASHEDV